MEEFAAPGFWEQNENGRSKNNSEPENEILEQRFIYARKLIGAGDCHTAALKSDGTVLACGNNDYMQCEVEHWTEIVSLDVGSHLTVGKYSDGTKVEAGYKYSALQSDSFIAPSREPGKDAVYTSSNLYHSVSLFSNGTVKATGDNTYGQCELTDWIDIVAVSAGLWHTVGLKADGTVLAVGSNDCGQCNVSGWKLFSHIDNLTFERGKHEKEAAQKRAQTLAALAAEKEKLEKELYALSGIFTLRRRRILEEKLLKNEVEQQFAQGKFREYLSTCISYETKRND